MQAVPLFWNDSCSKDAWKSLIPRCRAEETGGKAAVSWYSLEVTVRRWDAVIQYSKYLGLRGDGWQFSVSGGKWCTLPIAQDSAAKG